MGNFCPKGQFSTSIFGLSEIFFLLCKNRLFQSFWLWSFPRVFRNSLFSCFGSVTETFGPKVLVMLSRWLNGAFLEALGRFYTAWKCPKSFGTHPRCPYNGLDPGLVWWKLNLTLKVRSSFLPIFPVWFRWRVLCWFTEVSPFININSI